jgi:hypothetical protein
MVDTATTARERWRAKEPQKEMLSLIPAEGSALAGLPYLSHLAKRDQLHSLHFTLRGPREPSRAGYPPQMPDAVFLNAADTATFNRAKRHYHPTIVPETGPAIPDSEVLLHRYLRQATWRVYQRNAIAVFLRGEAAPPEAATGEGRKLDEFHVLAGLETAPPPVPGALKLVFTWEVGKDRPFLPWVRVLLRGADGKEWTLDKGPAALGWENGRFREEWLMAPPLLPGKYQGQILIQDNHETHRQHTLEPPFKSRRFDLGEISL